MNEFRHLCIGCFLALTLLLISESRAQSCDCPTNCATCAGGVIEFTLQFQASAAASVVVKDVANIIYDEEMEPGELFTVRGALQGGRFAGTKIYFYVDGVENTSIDVLCTSRVTANEAFGNFVIVEAKRLDGKAVCCAAGNNRDLIAPVFGLVPDDIFVFTTPGKCSAVVSWEKPLARDCNTVEIVTSHLSGSEFPKGTTLVTFKATDGAGNISLHTFTVTVTDNIPPMLTGCPGDMEVAASSAEGASVSWSSPTATDNCTVDRLIVSHSNGSNFPVGKTDVVYTAFDQDGNMSSCTFAINVSPPDNPDPDPDPDPQPELPPVLPPSESPDDVEVTKLVSPDGDGMNDKWILKNIEHHPGARVLILDRWGGTIYTAANYDNEVVVWRGEGMSSGKVPSGTYFYVISYTRNGIPVERRGFIELIQ